MNEHAVHVCSDCKAQAPATDTNYTLISSRYGWRLSRRASATGVLTVEWRCPRCWERFKKQRTGGGEVDSTTAAPLANREKPNAPSPRGAAPKRSSSRPPPTRR